MLAAKLLCGVGEEKLYVDDVFSAYTYTGNGSTQTITNGIDLSGQGGMVWTKDRTNAYNHNIQDTVRGVGNGLKPNAIDGNDAIADGINNFSSTGYVIKADAGSWVLNKNTDAYASWTFRKAPKFFDVVTWTGNATNRTISHSLGQEVGLMFVKRTDTPADWQVYHRSLANTEYAVLNSTAAKATGATRWNSTTPTSSVFSVGTDTTVNASGGTYVAYVFAHDTSTDGIIQCGSFTTDGSGNASVSLGWEPQYLMEKASSATGGWFIHDTSRGFNVSGTAYLYANTVGAESVSATNYYKPTANGFVVTAEIPSTTYVYMAIRRPNKPPTVGTQVYQAIARTGTGAAATVTGVGFAPDLLVTKLRNSTATTRFVDRLRGSLPTLGSTTAAVESTVADEVSSFTMEGVVLGSGSINGEFNWSAGTFINHFFKRAPGVFDQVCFTGAASGTQVISHNLGAVPEFLICKSRGATGGWIVYFGNVNKILQLQTTSAETTIASFWPASPTASDFTIDPGNIGIVSTTAVAYLFATKAGISKVGSYTGNATTKQIDCGFTTGARFVLIKRTDSTGDWYVWDTVRGIIAGNDPYLLLNSTAAEVTSTDYIDPYTSGFELSSTAPAAINASGGTYIYLAFA